MVTYRKSDQNSQEKKGLVHPSEEIGLVEVIKKQNDNF